MNIETILNKKGQFVSFTTKRAVKTRKGTPLIEKISNFVARVGVDYDNIKTVQEKRESGELPEQNSGLPYGQWVNFPYIIEHKGKEYVRVTAVHNTHQKPKVSYIRNGQEISEEEVKKTALASEFRKNELDVFDIKVENILEIK